MPVLFCLQEDEFLGFTEHDIKKAEKHLSAVSVALVLAQKAPSHKAAPSGSIQRPVERTSGRDSSRKVVSALVKQGLAQCKNITKKVPGFKQKEKKIDSKLKKNWEMKVKISHKNKKAKNLPTPKDEFDSALKGTFGKLKRIKIRLGSDGQAAKIVRSRGRPCIYEQSCHMAGQSGEQKLIKKKKQEQVVAKSDDSDDDGILYSIKPLSEKVKLKNCPKVSKKNQSSPRKHAEPAKSKKPNQAVTLPQKVRASAIAKQLLTRAKHTGKGGKPTHSRATAEDNVKKTMKRKQFVMPSVSSRSARKITPNKRFFDENFRGADQEYLLSAEHAMEIPPLMRVGENAIPSESLDSGSVLLQSPKRGLFDLPQIMEGKRERKPSMKLIRKFQDEPQPTPKRISDEVLRKQDSPRRMSAWKQSHLLKSRTSSSERRRGDRSGKIRSIKQGHSAILQKAKFRLNQAAVNRSKAALAKTLKKEMNQGSIRGSTNIGKGKDKSDKRPLKHPQFGAVPISAAPVSPIKTSLKKEPAKFGSSGLPQGNIFFSVLIYFPI